MKIGKRETSKLNHYAQYLEKVSKDHSLPRMRDQTIKKNDWKEI